MSEEHVHDVALSVTRRASDGVREFRADGPCRTCGQVVDLPAQDEQSIHRLRGPVQFPPGVTVTTTVVGHLPEGEAPIGG